MPLGMSKQEKKKTTSIEREQGMRKVWMEKEKNSWDGIWHTEQCNLGYTVKRKKALIN